MFRQIDLKKRRKASLRCLGYKILGIEINLILYISLYDFIFNRGYFVCNSIYIYRKKARFDILATVSDKRFVS